MRRLLFAVALLIAGCGPSLRIGVDPFTKARTVVQRDASAASSILQPWHRLGFGWNEKAPDYIVLVVGVREIDNIVGADFNADGTIITAKPLTASVEYGDPRKGVPSIRQFSVSYDEFVKIAAARNVAYRIDRISSKTVSTFGQDEGGEVAPLFAPFLAEVRKIRGR